MPEPHDHCRPDRRYLQRGEIRGVPARDGDRAADPAARVEPQHFDAAVCLPHRAHRDHAAPVGGDARLNVATKSPELPHSRRRPEAGAGSSRAHPHRYASRRVAPRCAEGYQERTAVVADGEVGADVTPRDELL
jgi:hypothetical protein